MSQLSTISKFYYGFVIDATNNKIDFKESGGELTAVLNSGSYTLTDFLTEVQRALNAAGSYVYAVTVTRSTRIVKIQATGGNIQLLTTTGSHIGVSTYSLLGFSGADKTGATNYSGSAASGSQYTPQFKLQSYVSPNDWKESISPSVNESASGLIEVIKFGTRQFLQFDIQWSTDRPQRSTGAITNNPTGIADLRSFMDYMITKGPLEFMEDKDTPATFFKVLCERTMDQATGTGYMLNEMYDKGAPGYFNTGVVKMRVVS